MSRASSQAVVAPAIKTSVFVVVTLLVLALIALELGANIPFLESRTEYKALFTNTSDLKSSDSVRVAGVEVGKVTSVDLTDAGHAMVTFTVDQARPLPDTVQVTVRYLNLTGDRFLELRQGPPSPRVLHEDDVIPPAQTAPALDLDVLLAGFNPLFQGLQPDQINGLSNDLITVLQGQGDTFESIFQRVASLTSTLADRDAVIGQVVTNLNQVLGTLDQNAPALGDTISRVQTLVSGLNADRSRLGESLPNADKLVTSVDGFLGRVRGPLRNSVDQVQRVADQANAGEAALDQVLSMLPGAYLRISRVASRGSMYNLFICQVRVKLTGPDGRPIYTPNIGPSKNTQRCQPGPVAPLETPAQRPQSELEQQQLDAQLGRQVGK